MEEFAVVFLLVDVLAEELAVGIMRVEVLEEELEVDFARFEILAEKKPAVDLRPKVTPNERGEYVHLAKVAVALQFLADREGGGRTESDKYR